MNKSGVAVNKQGLVQIYERHSSEIFRYACRMLDNKDLAEDCVADTFLRLLIAVRGGILPENVRAYLYRIAHNWIIDHYRHRPPPQVTLEESFHPDSEGSVPRLVAQELDRQRIRSALAQLSAEQRQVIELRFIENWSHNEVAVAVGKSVEATRALQYRAVEALRQILVEKGWVDDVHE